ncbi:MAG: hypothetical protein ACRBBR_03100 [Cellvibrionaceae bacterium]
MKTPILTSALLAVLISSTLPAQAASKKPYCSAGSNSGVHWVTWSAGDIKSACYTAMIKTFKKGKHVDALSKGYYKTAGLNKASLTCKEGKKKVVGNGTEVFTNAVNMKNQLGWKKGCVIVVK